MSALLRILRGAVRLIALIAMFLFIPVSCAFVLSQQAADNAWLRNGAHVALVLLFIAPLLYLAWEIGGDE